ncbi:neuropeptide Y receptor type 2 [Uranotaenia lowii]|uniref:neuropeptide Y receptor type 2 n=1 Tax=Uranotaenia lowii TaxID=190385 RepID=UPI00247A7739|nr:neuropeptide Y receptor type 2 [Uranotaenia lowii]
MAITVTLATTLASGKMTDGSARVSLLPSSTEMTTYNILNEAINFTVPGIPIGEDLVERNSTSSQPQEMEDIIMSNQFVQTIFYILYSSIFILGIFGNVLVCYVVFRNKAMQSVTNLFITNLALSDILLCVLAVPFTPTYTFLGRWVFGQLICHTLPMAQGCSIYISTLTLTSIAIDRFFVIIYPFHPRMKLSTCIFIIILIWIFSVLVTLPYGLFMRMHDDANGTYLNTTLLNATTPENKTYYCEEMWPSEDMRKVFSIVTSILQFVLPFIIMAFCYICVSIKLNDRARTKPGSKTTRREEAERDRKKRTNRMLIAMVTIFGVSWLPLNLVNMCNDYYPDINGLPFFNLLFFIAHLTAMSSTCYNPFLYAWLNENFRKEFKQVLPCFDPSRGRSAVSTRRSEHRTCNGNETIQETLIPSSQILPPLMSRSPNTTTTTTTTNTSESNKQTVDSILLSEVVPPPLQNPPLLPSIQSQETIMLPSGVLETPFEVKLPPPPQKCASNGNSKSSSTNTTTTSSTTTNINNNNGFGNGGISKMATNANKSVTISSTSTNPKLQSLILINDGTCGDTKVPEVL